MELIKYIFNIILNLNIKKVITKKTVKKEIIFKKFTIKDFTRSNTAEKYKIDNSIKSQIIRKNIVHTIAIAERVRKILGVDLNITSCYRCKKLNDIIGGAKTSHHLKAQAFDFTCIYTPEEVCNKLKNSEIPYDQLIDEGTWTHIGCPKNKKLRRQFLDLS